MIDQLKIMERDIASSSTCILFFRISLPYDAIYLWMFTNRGLQRDIDRLPQILQNIPDIERTAMQHALSHVWHRFTYSTLPLFQKASHLGVGRQQLM